jgi:hypothetical protein
MLNCGYSGSTTRRVMLRKGKGKGRACMCVSALPRAQAGVGDGVQGASTHRVPCLRAGECDWTHRRTVLRVAQSSLAIPNTEGSDKAPGWPKLEKGRSAGAQGGRARGRGVRGGSGSGSGAARGEGKRHHERLLPVNHRCARGAAPGAAVHAGRGCCAAGRWGRAPHALRRPAAPPPACALPRLVRRASTLAPHPPRPLPPLGADLATSTALVLALHGWRLNRGEFSLHALVDSADVARMPGR